MKFFPKGLFFFWRTRRSLLDANITWATCNTFIGQLVVLVARSQMNQNELFVNSVTAITTVMLTWGVEE